MVSNKERFGRGIGRRDFLKVAGAAVAAPALAGIPAVARAEDPVELTFWAWTPDTQTQVDLFMKAHPNIKVKLENVGQGPPHYVKMRNAIKAGTGLPDVAQMEFNSIPSFKQLGVLADLGPNGATAVGPKFVDWTWKQVSDGDKVLGIPWDSGPMGVLYRADVFEKYKIGVAETWDDYAENALKLSKDSGGKVYLTEFAGASDAGWVAGVLWQAGWRPFHTEGTDITIRLNDDVAKKWSAYWQKLVDAKAVDLQPAWTTEWYTSLDEGTIASWVTAAWGAVFLPQFAKKSFGHWRASHMPQWEKGGKVSSNWGGSTFAAMTTSPHPKEAAEFAVFMGSNPEAAKLWATKQYLFPVLKELIEDKELMGHKFELYGGQAVNEIFVEAENRVDPSFEFAPFQDYVNAQMQDEIAKALTGNGTIADAFDRLQTSVVAYAEDQGYTVKS